MSNDKKSEFGEGMTYCIGLFLAHKFFHKDASVSLWFNGAGDHLYGLNTNSISCPDLKKDVDAWRNSVLKWRLSYNATEQDKEWAISKATEFLRRIDELMLNTPTKQGEWE
ncbi:MAG: hypothetical protein WC356_01830 [Candidatus Micrarchaeia archaeon]|jgi:hypothetical protein